MPLSYLFRMFTFSQYPKQLKFIFWNEAAERFAFYGMRAILVIYISQYLKVSNNISSAIFNYFNAFAYLTPLIGAYLADKYLGKFKTIIIFSLIYAFGFIVLAFTNTLSGLLIALFLIGLGTGGIKPCISTFMGEQLDHTASNYETVRAKAFSLFYFMINIGSISSTLITPITREIFGPKIAFSVPAVLMFISIIIFYMGKKYYIHVETKKEEHIPFFKVIWCALLNIRHKKKNDTILSGALKKYSQKDVDGTYNLLQIMKLFIFMTIFYGVWDQQGSSWIIQALDMENICFGIRIPPDIMQVFNPLFILFLVPIFNNFIYPWLNKLFELTAFRKITIGIIISGLSFISLGIYQQFLDSGIKINILWQVISYFLITVSEVFLTITFIEFAYSQSPKNMRSIIMSLYWLTFFLGDLFAGFILQINIFKGAIFFYFFAFLAIAIGILFIFVARTYKQKHI